MRGTQGQLGMVVRSAYFKRLTNYKRRERKALFLQTSAFPGGSVPGLARLRHGRNAVTCLLFCDVSAGAGLGVR